MRVGEFIRERKIPISIAAVAACTVLAMRGVEVPYEVEGQAAAAPVKYDERGLPVDPCWWTPNNPQQAVSKGGGAGFEALVDGRCVGHGDGGIHTYLEPRRDEDLVIPRVDGYPATVSPGDRLQVYCIALGELTANQNYAVSSDWAKVEVPVGSRQSVGGYIATVDMGFLASSPTGVPQC